MDKDLIFLALADDDPDDREIFSEALEQVDPKVQLLLFEGGKPLMDYLQNGPDQLPDILFLDLNMPVMNGQACLTKIRQHQQLKDIKVAIYSTSSSRNHIDETQQMGANWYLYKPNSYSGVMEMLKTMLHRAKVSPDATGDFFMQF